MKINYNCQGLDTLPFTSLLPFQGALKTRTEDDLKNLMESLITVGLCTPFFIWHKPESMGGSHAAQPHFILDGHARHAAIQKIAELQPEVLGQEYPVVFVVAETLEEAKHILLEMSSQYGKITTKGLQTFLVDAPKINIAKMGLKVRIPVLKTPVVSNKVVEEKAILKLRVPKDKMKEVMEVLKSCSFIEVL